jgi:hypothetical protein
VRRDATQRVWRRRNPDYFHARRLHDRQVAVEAGTTPAPLVLPPPLSSLAWDLAQDEFGVTGTDFLGQMSRVLLTAARGQRAVAVVAPTRDGVRLPPEAAQDQYPLSSR